MRIIFQERRGEEKVRKLQLLTFENQMNELKLCNTKKKKLPFQEHDHHQYLRAKSRTDVEY